MSDSKNEVCESEKKQKLTLSTSSDVKEKPEGDNSVEELNKDTESNGNQSSGLGALLSLSTYSSDSSDSDT